MEQETGVVMINAIEQFARKNVPVNKDGFIRDFMHLIEWSDGLTIREFIVELNKLIDDYGIDHTHKNELFSITLM